MNQEKYRCGENCGHDACHPKKPSPKEEVNKCCPLCGKKVNNIFECDCKIPDIKIVPSPKEEESKCCGVEVLELSGKPYCRDCRNELPSPKVAIDGVERIAMNIVYQLGDFYTLSAKLRQETNDEAIDFVMKLISSTINEVIKEERESIIRDIEKEQETTRLEQFTVDTIIKIIKSKYE